MTIGTPTLLTGSTSSADTTSYNTASVTPGVGNRILVLVVSGKSANLSESPTSVSQGAGGGMGSLTKIGEQAVPNNNLTLTAWTGIGTGVAGSINILHANTMENCAWQVISISSDVATPTIEQVDVEASAASGSAGATLSPGAADGAMNIGAMCFNASAGFTPTANASFTTIGTRLSQTSPTTQLWSMYDYTAPIANTAAWSFPTTTGHATLAIEVRDGVAPPEDPTVSLYDGADEVPVTVSMWDGSNEVDLTFAIN